MLKKPNLRLAACKITHKKGYHFGEVITHAAYFSFVFMEGHGGYAVAGGLMVIFTIVSILGEWGEDA